MRVDHFYISWFVFQILACFSLSAQKEYTNWYFGNQAAINFVAGGPVNVAGSVMTMADCPASISDSAGNLLFYSSPNQVWDRTNTLMPNGSGLIGDPSGGQPANIVRIPCHPSQYYLFTNAAYGGASGLRYSMIDMTLHGGLGDVAPAIKNVVLLASASEQVLLTKDANGRDAWLIARPSNSGAFNVYHITSAGINTTPVVSTIGAYRGTGDDACGQITIDSSGQHIAMAHYTANNFELYNFNNATGVISNVITIPNINRAWGLEFSADGTKLYLSGWTTQYVSQFDLTNYTQTAITNSMVNLGNVTGPGGPYYTGYMQRGPDGKIYIAVYLDNYLAVINSPNATGIACNLVDNGFNLGTAKSQAGLPDKVVLTPANLVVNLGSDTSVCAGQPVMLNAGNTGAIYNWSNGSTTQTITADSAGLYRVSISLGGCQGTDSMRISNTTAAGSFSLGNDTAYCGPFSRLLSTGSANTIWSTGATSPQITVNTPGTYWAVDSSGCSRAVDTIVLTANPIPVVQLSGDSLLCPASNTILSATNPNATYRWQDGSTGPSYTVTTPGTYSVTVTSNNGCSASGSVPVQSGTSPTPFSLGNDTTYCGNFSRVLTTGGRPALWSTGSNSPQITVNAPGMYWAKITNACGSFSDSVTIAQSIAPLANLGNDTTLCPGDVLVLNPSNPNATYVWQDNSTNNSYTVVTSGTYSVTVTNANGCSSSDSIAINYSAPPAPFTIGNDTTYCTNFIRVLATGQGVATWSTGATSPQITVNTPGLYWAKVSNQCGAVSDSITINQTAPPLASLGNDTTLCPGDVLVLNPSNPNATYIWQDNSANNSFTVVTSGTYSVTVTNNNGCTSSDTILISYTNPPTPFVLGNDTAYCGNFSRSLSTDSANTLWSTGTRAQTITVNQPGIYWASISNQCGMAADTLTLTENQPPAVNLGNDTTLCTGQTITLNTANPGSTYHWQDNSTNNSLIVSGPGAYAVTVTNSLGCLTADTVAINYVSQAPQIGLGNDTTFCQQFSISLSSGYANTLWSTGAAGTILSIATPGVYWAQVSNACGTARDSITIAESHPPQLTFGTTPPICPGDTIKLMPVSNATNFLWSNGDTSSSINVNIPGTYSVKAWNNADCPANGEAAVKTGAAPEVSLGNDTSFCGNTLLLSPGIANAHYNWQDNSTDSLYTVTTSGTYRVTVSNNCGSASAQKTVQLYEDECALLIPNAFSPNGDGKNDLFRVISRCPTSNFTIHIYNRWGNLVYQSNDITEGWDGVYKGVAQPLDVFVYYVDYYNYCKGGMDKKAGNITLLR